ncbi:MAG: hypothetical protein M3Z16_01830, partial [Pseudomonadota bacterium]|nr:hypothetical protein [Pseudomonadota bacterium]
LSVLAGGVCSVMPGAMVCAVRGHGELEALPLIGPEIAVPISFFIPDTDRVSRTLQAALDYAQDDTWLAHAALNAGSLGGLYPGSTVATD